MATTTRKLWLVAALVWLPCNVRLVRSEDKSEALSLPRDPVSDTLLLFGFRPVERDIHYSTLTPENDDVSQRKWKILDPPSTPLPNAAAANINRAIIRAGKIREFRFYGNSRSATDTTSVYLSLLEAQADGDYRVVLSTMLPMVGPEDTLFRVTSLDSDFWDSLDDRTQPGMLMAVAVETSDVDSLAGAGVSYWYRNPSHCGTTYSYQGDMTLYKTIPKAHMHADQRCMVMSLQLVVDL